MNAPSTAPLIPLLCPFPGFLRPNRKRRRYLHLVAPSCTNLQEKNWRSVLFRVLPGTYPDHKNVKTDWNHFGAPRLGWRHRPDESAPDLSLTKKHKTCLTRPTRPTEPS